MSDFKPNVAAATDWTGLLADPDLACNLGKLLQIYRDAPPERREEALLAAMRQIKQDTASSVKSSAVKSGTKERQIHAAHKAASSQVPARPTPTATVPPFEPNIFGPTLGQDRRRYPRIKCFVAVELHVSGANNPIWGNLSNTSLGGCQVETAASISTGAKVEIGLWVASGKIWVKGLALSGIVSRNTAAGGVRVRFAAMEPAEKDNLRQFLKYVQETTAVSYSESSYLQLLK